MNNHNSTWGSPYAEVTIIGKRKYALILRRLVAFMVIALVALIVTMLSFIVFKIATTEFEELVFDDGTPVKCVLRPDSPRPFPSVMYEQANK